MAREGDPRDYQKTMRAVTRELTRQVRIRACKLRILLLVLAELLLQQSVEGRVTATAQTGAFDIFPKVLNHVDSLDLEHFDESECFLDHEWMAAVISPLSPLAIDIMSFLENAECENMEDTAEEATFVREAKPREARTRSKNPRTSAPTSVHQPVCEGKGGSGRKQSADSGKGEMNKGEKAAGTTTRGSTEDGYQSRDTLYDCRGITGVCWFKR